MKKQHYIILALSIFVLLPYKEIISFILDRSMFWIFAGIFALIIYAYVGLTKDRKVKASLDEFKVSSKYDISDSFRKKYAKK